MKNIIILGAGVYQKPVYEEAKKLKFKIVSVDSDPKAPCRKLSDYFICESFKKTKKCVDKLRQLKIKFHGIVTFGAEASINVAEIGKYFSLNVINPTVAKWTTYKSLRSKRLLKKKIPIPKFIIKKKFSNNKKFKYPFIVKPSDSSGSRGVKLVNNKFDYFKAFQDAIKESLRKEVIVEEYLAGKEINIEGFVINKKLYITGIADRYYLNLKSTYPNIVEYMGVVPSNLKKNIIEKVKKVFERAVRALKIYNGPTKGDILIKDDKVYVLEITSRTSPTFASETQKLSTGINLPKILILWSTGYKIAKSMFKTNFSYYVSHRYFIHKKGKISKIYGVNKARSSDGIKIFKFLTNVRPGLVLKDVRYMNRLIYVVARAKTYNRAVSKSKKALSKIKIIYEK